MKMLRIILIVSLILSAGNGFSQSCNNSLSTFFNTNNGQDGIMFTLTAKRNIVIDSFANNHGTGTIPGYEIYYKCGDAASATTTPGAWTLLGSASNIVSAGQNNPTTIPISLNVPVGEYQTVAFYLTTTGSGPICRYTNGTVVCDSLTGNNDLYTHDGYGKDYPFGATFNPRQFYGIVYYHCTANFSPTIQGDFSFCNLNPGDQKDYYLDPPLPSNCSGGTGVSWILPNGTSAVGPIDDDTVTVSFNSATVSGQICAALLGCNNTDTTAIICEPLVSQPATANAGPDTVLCSETYQLQGNVASGYWQVLSGSGVIANPGQYNSTITGLSIGANDLSWTVGGNGCPVSTDNVTITVSPLAVAQFNPRSGCDGDQIQFIDSSYALGGNIISWNWDVDGDASVDYTTSSFNHVYSAPGTYQCTLSVTASQGCVDTVIHSVVVYPRPAAEFFYTPDCEGTPVSFLDTTDFPGGTIDSWKWEFGDNTNPSFSQDPGHVYQNDGLYLVTLTVESSNGCIDSYTDTAEVYSIPDVDFYAEELCADDTVVFLDSSSSIQGELNYWDWDFGDGSPTVQVEDTSHSYNGVHGTFSVRLTVATDKGCTNTVVKPHRSFPLPEPDYKQDGVCEAQEIFYTDKSQVDNVFNSQITGWNWDFGDGSSANTEVAGHFYQDPGIHTLTFTPYTNYGCFKTNEYQILVRPKPEANAIVLDDEVCSGTPISYLDKTFFDYTYDTTGVVFWKWNFGDSTTSRKKDPVHKFEMGGEFNTQLTVRTSYGCEDSAFVKTVVFHRPIADFTFDTIEGCSPHCVTFLNQTEYPNPDDTLLYHWDFGDGEHNFIDLVPTHCYNVKDGTGLNEFPVKMDVTSPDGCIDSFKLAKNVMVHARPIADFELSDNVISYLEPVVLIQDYSIGADEYLWDFGDSVTSTSTAVTKHQYELPGSYTIELMVRDDYGCSDSIYKSLLVERHQTFYIPNSFTPNGDGINDYFEVHGEDFEYIKLWIYDRWGDQLYYGENENARWNGKYNGRTMSIGSYSFVVEYKKPNQIKQIEKGNLILSKAKSN